MEYQIIEKDLFISIKEDVIEYYHNYKSQTDLLLKIGEYQTYIFNNYDINKKYLYHRLALLFNHIDENETSGDLYFMIDDTMTKVKIGRSYNVDKRFIQLKRNTPFNISLLKVIECGGMFEKKIHKSFEHCNLRFDKPFDGSTEWFFIDDKLNKFISSIDNKKLIKKYGS
jgi:hypothetical protein